MPPKKSKPDQDNNSTGDAMLADMYRIGSRGRGKPRAFEDETELIETFAEYLLKCKQYDRFVNIAGFCSFADITRDTFYMQQEYYPDTYSKIHQLIEDLTINNRNIPMAIFYLKNKHGYSDRPEQEASENAALNSMHDDELDKRLEKRYLEITGKSE